MIMMIPGPDHTCTQYVAINNLTLYMYMACRLTKAGHYVSIIYTCTCTQCIFSMHVLKHCHMSYTFLKQLRRPLHTHMTGIGIGVIRKKTLLKWA